MNIENTEGYKVAGIFEDMELLEFEDQILDWGKEPAPMKAKQARQDIHRYLILLENQANLARAALNRLGGTVIGTTSDYDDGYEDGLEEGRIEGYAEGYKAAAEDADEPLRDLIRWLEDRERRGESITPASVLDQIRFPSPLP